MSQRRPFISLAVIALGVCACFLNQLSGQTVALPMDVADLGFSTTGKILAVRDKSGSLILWNSLKNKQRATLEAADVVPVLPAFAKGDQEMAAAHAGGKVRIYDLRDDAPKVLAECRNIQATALAFGRDGAALATGDATGRVQLWDAKTADEIVLQGTPTSAAAPVRSLTFSGDGEWLIWETAQNIHVRQLHWKANVPQIVDERALKGFGSAAIPRFLALSPDAKVLVVADRKTMAFVDPHKGEKWTERKFPDEIVAVRFRETGPAFLRGRLGFIDVRGTAGEATFTTDRTIEVTIRGPLRGLPEGSLLQRASLAGDAQRTAFVTDHQQAGMTLPATKKDGPPPKDDDPFKNLDPWAKKAIPKDGPPKGKNGGASTGVKDGAKSPPGTSVTSGKEPTIDAKQPPAVEHPGVEVFYGTNRSVREADSARQASIQVWNEVFSSVFSTSQGWWIGLRLALMYFMPPILIWLFYRQRLGAKVFAGFLAIIFVGFLGLQFLDDGWRQWDPWFFLLLGVISLGFFLFLCFCDATLVFSDNVGRLWKLAAVILAGSGLTVGTWVWLAWLQADAMIAAETFVVEPDKPEFIYTSHYSNQLQYGICYVSVPPRHAGDPVRFPQADALPARRINPDRDFFFFEIKRYHRPEEHSAFFAKLNQRIKERDAGEREAFVYIHGYNNSFREVAFRAAALKADLKFQGPAIIFSWPARGYVEDYPADEEAVDFSLGLFEQFLREVTEQSGAERIYVIAHSMGNRALAQALISFQRERWPYLKRFQHIVLAAPDINRDRFLIQLLPNLLALNRPMTLYASQHDRALRASYAFHKNSRAGLAGIDMIPTSGPLETIDVSPLRTGFMGHDYAFSEKIVIEDLGNIWKKDPITQIKRHLVETKMQPGPGSYWTFQVIP
jgi:esterase/lipase superfamily enzyme